MIAVHKIGCKGGDHQRHYQKRFKGIFGGYKCKEKDDKGKK